MRSLRRVFLALLVLGVGGAVWTAPRSIDYRPDVPALPDNLDGWLADREATVHRSTPLIADTEKRIRWVDPDRPQRTPLSLVYLHGFSATRQEVAPLGEVLADELGANLFETRLAGHGLTNAALVDVRAEDWLDDAVEALAIGAGIGERVIVIGTSTGATLAVALSDHPSFDDVAALVMISPNFAPKDGSAEILTWPGGPQLARLMVGETRSWTPANDQQAIYWSTTYPIDAAVEMMRLVKLARRRLPLMLSQPVLTLYSPNDDVVDTEWIEAAMREIESPHSEAIRVDFSGDPSNHVLAGNILAPENNAPVAEHILRFLSAATP